MVLKNVIKYLFIFLFGLNLQVNCQSSPQINQINCGFASPNMKPYKYSPTDKFEVDNNGLRHFAMYHPNINDKSIKYPLIIVFHGAGANPYDACVAGNYPNISGYINGVLVDGLNESKYNTQMQQSFYDGKFVVIAPLGDLTNNQINEFIDIAIIHYSVNENQIYLSGGSGGGQRPFKFISASDCNASRIAAVLAECQSWSPSSATTCQTVVKNHVGIWNILMYRDIVGQAAEIGEGNPTYTTSTLPNFENTTTAVATNFCSSKVANPKAIITRLIGNLQPNVQGGYHWSTIAANYLEGKQIPETDNSMDSKADFYPFSSAELSSNKNLYKWLLRNSREFNLDNSNYFATLPSNPYNQIMYSRGTTIDGFNKINISISNTNINSSVIAKKSISVKAGNLQPGSKLIIQNCNPSIVDNGYAKEGVHDELSNFNNSSLLLTNPVEDQLLLNLDENYESLIEIYSITGQLLRRENLNKEFSEININKLDNGIYYITVLQNKKLKVDKFVVQK